MKRLILSLAPLTLAAGCATVPAQTGTTAFSEAIPHDITAGQARLAVQLYPKLAEAAEAGGGGGGGGGGACRRGGWPIVG